VVVKEVSVVAFAGHSEQRMKKTQTLLLFARPASVVALLLFARPAERVAIAFLVN
jgi:EamA domain-containing membrane protein RarD